MNLVHAKNAIIMIIIQNNNVIYMMMDIIYHLIKLANYVRKMLILKMVIAEFALIMALIMKKVHVIVIEIPFLIQIKLVLIVEKVVIIAF